jgi:prepilin-type N-terminal cleavage/methylation domain-containing protein
MRLSNTHTRVHHCRYRAFTLVEMLVSLTLLALISGMLIINLLPNPSTQLRDETIRLERVLTYAGDYARLSGHRLMWRWDKSAESTGYYFEIQDRDNAWKRFTTTKLTGESLNPYRIAKGVALQSLVVESTVLGVGEERLHFHPSGINALFSLTLQLMQQPDIQKTLESDPLGRVSERRSLPTPEGKP